MYLVCLKENLIAQPIDIYLLYRWSWPPYILYIAENNSEIDWRICRLSLYVFIISLFVQEGGKNRPHAKEMDEVSFGGTIGSYNFHNPICLDIKWYIFGLIDFRTYNISGYFIHSETISSKKDISLYEKDRKW